MGVKSRAVFQLAKKAAEEAFKEAVGNVVELAKKAAEEAAKKLINQAIEAYYETYGTIEPLLSLAGVTITLVPIPGEKVKKRVEISWDKATAKDIWRNLGANIIKQALGFDPKEKLDQIMSEFEKAKKIVQDASDTYQKQLEEAQDKQSQDSAIEMTNITSGPGLTQSMISENGSSITAVTTTVGQAVTTTVATKV